MRLADWAATMPVPSGDGAGEPWVVVPWQRRLFAAVERRGVQVIATSCARANGKTAVSALIARAYLPGGPLHKPGREVLVVSASHPQARLVIEDLEAWRGEDWLVANSPQIARVKAGGATVRAVAANPRTLHGARPDIIIADEVAQWQQPDRMYAALRTSLGKRAGARMLCLGTRPVSGSDHVFDNLLTGGADVSLVYAATEADEKAGRLGWRRTWLKANPTMRVLPSLEDSIRREWKEAQGDEMALARFKSLRLNMGTMDVAESVLLSVADYQRAMVEDADLPPRSGPLFLGIDLSETGMAAACGYSPNTGRLESVAVLPGIPSLDVRARRDQCGSLYRKLHASGGLIVQPGVRVLDVGAFLRAVVSRWGRPVLIACDRKRIDALRDAMDAAGVRCEIARRGVGFIDAGEDISDFTAAFVGGRVAVGRGNLVLAAAMAEARTLTDSAGNRKLARRAEAGRRSRARDDAVAAAVLAVAAGWRWRRRTGSVRPRLVAV